MASPSTPRTPFLFHTALYKTTLSGVIVDPDLQPIEGIRVGIIDSSILDFDNVEGDLLAAIKTTTTSSFGAFLLDDVPIGPHILYVDGTSPSDNSGGGDLLAAISNQNYPYLEFSVNIIEDTDNSLGRPIFLVPADLSTLTSVGDQNVGGASQPRSISFNNTDNSLTGFSITNETGAISFGDGTSTGNITATRIQPAHIPDRLPDGSIPHFMVHLSAHENSKSEIRNPNESEILNLKSKITFSPAASLTFPNVYELEPGETVKVFHFQYGAHNYLELGEAAVAGDGTITTEPILFESGFLGIIPSDPDFDLTKNYLRGRVVDINGDGIPGISVNAIAGSTSAFTDENGEYTITMPEVRIFVIQTIASIPTNLGQTDENSQIIVFQSELTELEPSGITEMPDIVVNTFFLGGSIRFVNTDGIKLPRTGVGYDTGNLVSLDDIIPHNVQIHIYTKNVGGDVPVADSSQSKIADPWSSIPYASTTTTLAPLGLGFDASFSIPIVTSVPDEPDDSAVPQGGIGGASPRRSSTPKPGDLIKIVAFSTDTGWYGETDFIIPSVGDSSVGADVLVGDSTLDILTKIDLRPPLLEVGMNRVFFIDGIRRRASIPQEGIVFTSDEFVEVKVKWTTPDLVPLDRNEIQFNARLMIDSINYQDDAFFTVRSGEHARILEIREALYPNRLAVLQKDTDIGTETFTFSPDGSFATDRLIPANVGGDVPVGDSSQSPILNLKSKIIFYVVELNITQQPDGSFDISGRAKPGLEITNGDQTLTAGEDGRFSSRVATIPDGGIEVKIGDTLATLVGASFAPKLSAIDPVQGSQGDTVTLTGEFFSIIPEENKVKFNGAAAVVTAASETELSVIVPNEASAGPITVAVAGKTSNGIFFDFVSEGIPNGSFEKEGLRGYTSTGTVIATTAHRTNLPTHGKTMARLSTVHDPVNGTSTLTTDRFFVSGGLGTMVFDYHFMGSLVFGDFKDYLEVRVIDSSTESIADTVFAPDIGKHVEGNISGFAVGSGLQTATVDLTAYEGQGIPIKVKFVVKGSGPIPPNRPGLLPDDDNPLGFPSTRGTALLLDNIRLTGAGGLPAAPDPAQITIGTRLMGSPQSQERKE